MAEETTDQHGFTEVADQPAASLPKSSVLRLRGLPFSAGEEDVRLFFAGFDVIQVVIGKRAGRSTGEGYVQLQSPAAAAEAIAKLHRQTLGPRYIEIFESTEADLATAKSLSVDRMRGFVVRCRGLPYTATAQDVLNFFGPDVPVVRGIEGVVFTYAPDGRPTGEAFVELQTEEAQREALKKHKESIGSRYIELFVSTKVDLIQAIQQNRLVLGYSNRKRWLQQQGISLGPGPAQHPGHMHPHPHGMQPYGSGPGPRRHPQQYGQVEEVTDMMSGFNMGGHVQVIGPGGQMLPPGAYPMEANGKPPQARFGYPGGRGGRGAGRGPGGAPGLYPGRGPAGGFPLGGRGMQQVVGMPPMPPAARQTAQVVPVSAAAGGGGGPVPVQDMQQQQGGGAGPYMMQQQQGPYDQPAAWAQGVMVQPPQPQQGAPGAGQQPAGLYGGAAGAQQQGGGIQGVAPGSYSLGGIAVPSGGGGGGYADYGQPVHSLQALDGSAGAGGLQSTWGPR